MSSEDHTSQEIWLILQSMGAKLDQFMHDNHEAHGQMRGILEIHNGRLRKSEVWRAYISGAMAVVIAIVSLVMIPIFIKSFYFVPTSITTNTTNNQ